MPLFTNSMHCVEWNGPAVSPRTPLPYCSFTTNMPMPSDPMIELLTRDEVARLLKISRAGVYRLVEGRRLTFYKVGHGLRFAKSDVMAYLRHHRVDALGTYQYGSTKTP